MSFPPRLLRLCYLLLASLLLHTSPGLAQDTATPAPPAEPPLDPTRASARVKAVLSLQNSGLADTQLKGLVIGSGKEGAVTLEFKGVTALARPGLPFNVSVNGSVKTLTASLTDSGVKLDAPNVDKSILLPSLASLPTSTSHIPGSVDYVEFRDLPLLEALRMLSDQTGFNYSASVAANKTPVNIMLRNISGEAVIEEICKSHNLWYKRDPGTGITRILTVPEFEKDLVGYREEQTEVFTLKFPNVPAIANAIADLYGDRVQLSLGGDDADDDARRDLENRFDRFQVLTQGAQNANSIDSTTLGGNVNGYGGNGYGGGTVVAGDNGGYRGYGGGYGGYGGGYGSNRNGSGYGNGYGQNRSVRRYNRNTTDYVASDDDLFRNLTPDQAQRVDQALTAARHAGENAADVESLRKHPANIFVTANRRSNLIAVRTADTRAMEDIRSLVRRMDRQTPMVLLEVKVVNVELGNDLKTAFDYQYSDGTNVASFSQNGIANPLTRGNIVSGGMNSSDMTFVIVSNNFRAQMQLLEEKNRVKTLATPTLLTANNEISRLFLGEERPLVRAISSQTILTQNSAATTPNTVTEFRNVGNTLLITPNINSDRTVTLRLVQENSTIDPNGASIPVVTGSANNTTAVQNVKVDVVATKSVSGTFVAKDGMAIAVGGLIEDDKVDKREQVPLLGDIPGLGILFRRQEKSKTRNELVVIIRPHVMSTPADGEKISTDLLKQLAPASVDRLVDDGFLPAPPPDLKATIPPRGDLPKADPPKKATPTQKRSR